MSSNFGATWTSEEIAFLKKLVYQKLSPSKIEEKFNKESLTNRNINKRSVAAIKRKIIRLNLSDSSTRESAITKKENFYNKLKVFEEISKKHKPSDYLQRKDKTFGKLTKTLILSDMHFPIVESELLAEIVLKHNDAETLVLNGDILDGYIFSSFQKDKTLAAIDEYRSAFDFLKWVQPRFKNVFITEGNHDNRVFRYLSDKLIPKEASSLFQPNLLKRMANGEELSEDGHVLCKYNWGNVHFDDHQSWYVKIGNAIICHPHFRITSTPGMGVNKVAKKINGIYHRSEIDCIIMGHTHATYKGVVNGQLLIEQGCLTTFSNYSFAAHSAYDSAPQLGYAVLYQDKEGHTDFNKTNFVYVGSNIPKPKVKGA